MSSLTVIQQVSVWVLPIIFAITLHEVAHGWVARSLGDNTAAEQGRLSLNPLQHVDPIGTVLLPLMMIIMSAGFIFGWAKPVPVDARNFRHPLRDMAIVAIAGPLANFVMAIGWSLLRQYALATHAQDGVWIGIQLMCERGIAINLMLMVLNLLPLLPLDGGRVLLALLPPKAAHEYMRVEPYGMIILLLASMTPLLAIVLSPIYVVCESLLLAVVGH
jgi:Zn-dependent protease